MAIAPPLDEITKLPAVGVDLLQGEFNKLVEQALDAAKEVINDSVKLPKSIKCDDPRIDKMKSDLQQVTDGIQKIQETIPVVQDVITGVKTVITTAQAIKATIAAAQLSNPLTVAQFIAATANALQDEIIANAVAAVIPLQAVPLQTVSKLETLVPPLLAAIARLNKACNEDIGLEIPSIATAIDESGIDDVDDVDDYNDLLSSEFYRDVNVSETDLDQRSNTIQQLVEQQQNLLTSLQEAPSQVYKQAGPPPAKLGKPGDYYINTQNNTPYGPKKSNTNWGGPIN